MSAVMVGCVAGGNVLLSLDDPNLFRDEGVVFVPYAETNPVNFGKAAPVGRLRRIAQAVTIGAPATIMLTPYGDGDEYEEQAQSAVLDPANGTTQVVELEPAVDGGRFQYRMTVTAFDGPVAFGEADLELIPKRSARA